jgi:predicted metal-dependent HD superfamily phosphohydrolase
MNSALAPRWANLCKQAGLDGSAEWQELSAAYGNPSRAYHNLEHIADCLLRFDEHAHLAIDPVAVEFAIWFHDIVHDARAADNEERSAVAAEGFLARISHTRVWGEVFELPWLEICRFFRRVFHK